MMLPPKTRQLLQRFADRGSAAVEDILAKPRGGQGARPKRTRGEFVAGQIAISDRCAALPVLDPRAPDELIGYNDRGAFS